MVILVAKVNSLELLYFMMESAGICPLLVSGY